MNKILVPLTCFSVLIWLSFICAYYANTNHDDIKNWLEIASTGFGFASAVALICVALGILSYIIPKAFE